MESIVLRNYDLRNDSLQELIGYAGITAGYAVELLSFMQGGQEAERHATRFILEIALIDLKRTMDLLEEEAGRREDAAKAASQSEVGLPHMMEEMTARLEAERSEKGGEA